MSPSIDPATDFNGAQEEVNALIRQPHIEPFALARVRKRVEALAKADPCGRFELLAALAARNGNLDEADAQFRKAMQFPGERVETIGRHLQFMQVTLHYRRVKELCEEFYTLLRNSPGGLRAMNESLSMCGYFASVEKLTPDYERLKADAMGNFRNAASIFKSAGFAEDEVAVVVAHCMAFLREERRFADAHRSHLLGPLEGDEGILVEFVADGDVEDLVALEWRLMESVAEKEYPIVESGFLSVGIVARPEGDSSCL